jgi:hypothetical protein
LYRQHLTNVYRALNVPVPEELSRPILMTRTEDLHQAPLNPIQPIIDGEVTSYFEWMGAGHYRSDARPGAMHGSRNIARDLFYGADDSNLYVRLDFDGAPEFGSIELRTKTGKLALLSDPGIERAHKRIFEARVPFELLKVSKDEPLSFQVALMDSSGALEPIPPDAWIDLTLANA